MAGSGTSYFAPQIDDLLTEAWERCKLSPAILTGEHARSARRSLFAMAIEWTNRGINLWQVDRQNTTAVVGERDIATPPGTVDVLEVVIADRNLELLLTPVSRDEWAGISDKGLRARPTQFWCERLVDAVVIHLWPVPDQNYAVGINRIRQPQDVTSMGDGIDAPLLWVEAIYAGLAARLAAKFCAMDLEAKLVQQADAAYGSAARENRERVPLTLLPRLW